jgi:hypothetical protein
MTIRVVPARLDLLAALAKSDVAFVERFGLLLEPGMIGFPKLCPSPWERARVRDADPWGPHLFFDDEGNLVGFGGFKGPRWRAASRSANIIAPSRRGFVHVDSTADPDGDVAEDVYRRELVLKSATL